MTRAELGKTLLDEARNINTFYRLFLLYDDLDRITLYPNQFRYTSKAVNKEGDPEKVRLEISRGCGCCPDAGYYVTPRLTIDGVFLYSPDKCYIGSGLSNGSGVDALGLLTRFEEYKGFGYSNAVIEAIETFIAENPPVEYEDDEEDDEQDYE